MPSGVVWKPAGERYELRDPFAEVTYRSNRITEIIAKADQLIGIDVDALAHDRADDGIETGAISPADEQPDAHRRILRRPGTRIATDL